MARAFARKDSAKHFNGDELATTTHNALKMADGKSQKRKRGEPTSARDASLLDTSKPTATYKPTKGRLHTVSVALPGSVVANAQSHHAKTSVIGSIARALAVFCIDEIVIFDDGCNSLYNKPQYGDRAREDAESGYTAFSDPNNYMFQLLSYLECPPHLRRNLMPMSANFKSAGTLPSLDIPSHSSANEQVPYREGVTVVRGAVDVRKNRHFVYVGLDDKVLLNPPLPEALEPNTRITVKLHDQAEGAEQMEGEAVAPEAPREEAGYYWGYVPRMASSLTEVFTECPYEGGYDFSVGMSERGTPLRDLVASSQDGTSNGTTAPKQWNHLLIAFGGPPGLEKAAQNDKTLKEKGVTEASELFDKWISFMDGQGSRTIRTEEALWIGLMGCWEMIRGREVVDDQRLTVRQMQ